LKLGKNTSTNTTHIIHPTRYYSFVNDYSFCGLIGGWPKVKIFKFFDGELELVKLWYL